MILKASLLLWAISLLAPGCSSVVEEGLAARALAPIAEVGHAQSGEVPGDGTEQGDAEAQSRPRIVADPETLRVYRATPVELAAEPPAGLSAERFARASCRWGFGDGTPEREGCVISHTFLRGTSDERVTLTISTGDETLSASRILPLERLPVSPEAPQGAVAGAPPPPEGPSSFRLALIAETAPTSPAPPGRLAGLASTLLALSPGLVVHLGDATGDASGWEELREALVEPLARAGVPLAWALSPSDLAADPVVRHPASAEGPLELAPGSRFPTRYAFTFKGVQLTVMTGDAQDDETLAWLRERLEEAQVYEARVVLSSQPLHPYSARATPTLGPRFKLYELFLRARVSLLATAGHGVHYAARYGALPVVSVGRIDGAPAALAGHELAQPPTLTLVDVEDGRLARIHALEQTPDGRWLPLDPAYLPDRVEVYSR